MEKISRLGPRPAAQADPVDLGPAARRVLEAMREQGRALRVGEIAPLVGSHENTVRSHLAELVERRLVTTSAAPVIGRGRPALRYAAGARPGTRTDEYRALTGAFAADLVRLDDGGTRRRARRIGRVWGERLHLPRAKGEPARLDAALADLGFGPEREGEMVRLTTCPLLELAEENPDVICQVHLGLVEGLLGRGKPDEDVELAPFAEPGACLLRVPGH